MGWVSEMVFFPLWSGDQWQLAGDVATTFGLGSGAVAVLISAAAFWSSAETARVAHMHGLFQTYLQHYMDHRRDGRANPAMAQLMGTKLYALEAIFEWQARKLRSWNAKDRALAEIWRSTIRVHAREDRDFTFQSIEEYTDCYSVDLLDFIATDWTKVFPAGDDKAEKLRELVSRHRQFSKGRQRPDPIQAVKREAAEAAIRARAKRKRTQPSKTRVAAVTSS